MVNNYLILLPPSEGKNKGGDESKPYRIIQNLKKYNTFISLNSEREFILEKLKQLISIVNEKELESVFELKGKNLQEAIEINLDLLNEETMPSIGRYDGVMFKSIDYKKMSEAQKNNFNFSVLFIDGMFGLLKPQDFIPEYKLKITSKIGDINITNYWKTNLRPYFKMLFKDKLIIDLLPEAHRKVIDFNEEDNYISIKFCELKNSKLVNVGHDSKKLKGEIINYITSFENIKINDLKNFKDMREYKFNEKYSNEKEIVYLK